MKCPTCKRTAEIDDVACNRCGTDLRILQELVTAADSAINHGNRNLALNQPQKAQDYFAKALGLISDSKEATRGLALSSLMLGNFADAVRWHAYFHRHSD